VKYVPRHGPLSPSHGWVASGPLSLAKMTIVFFYACFLDRVQNLSSAVVHLGQTIAQSPLPGLPTNSIFGSVGKWNMRRVFDQFTRSYSLTTALAPFTPRVWLTISLCAALPM
jgi:hypothetical protein